MIFSPRSLNLVTLTAGAGGKALRTPGISESNQMDACRMCHSVARSLPNPPGRPERENTASVTFSQTRKSELRRRAAPIDLTHLVNTHDRTQTRRCGPLSDLTTAIFQARSAQCLVCEDAPGGQLGRPLRHAIAHYAKEWV